MQSIKDQKQDLRRVLQERLCEIDWKEISPQICFFLGNLKPGGILGAFWPWIGQEPDIRPFLENTKNPVAFSTVDGMFSVWDRQEVPQHLGVLSNNSHLLIPSLILVPMVAFTASGFRLGRGKGYYDRFIEKFPTSFFLGLAASSQQVESLPIEPHDRPLDAIITEKRMISFSKKQLPKIF